MANESALVTACLNYLACCENAGHISHYDRLNSGIIYAKRGRFINRIRLCRSGTPDIYIITTQGELVWIECKRGSKLSDDQMEFKEKMEKAGIDYYVVSDLIELKCIVEDITESTLED